MLWTCAQARKIEPDQFEQWFVNEGLNDPSQFLPALDARIEAMVSEGMALRSETGRSELNSAALSIARQATDRPL